MEFTTDNKTINLQIAREYKSLLKISYQTLSNDDKVLIRKALDVAIDAHSTQTRKSGRPYIFHPLSVAKIVASKIGLDAQSIASALLHDVVEDTKYSIIQIEEIFGSEIADILNCNPHNLPRFTDVPSKFKVVIFDFFASSSIFLYVSSGTDFDKTTSLDFDIEFITCFVPKVHSSAFRASFKVFSSIFCIDTPLKNSIYATYRFIGIISNHDCFYQV